MRRGGSRGQSMVELAILLPILVTLFLGSWTAADLISDNNAAAQASRAGARFAAELGNGGWKSGAGASGCQTGGTDPCKLDARDRRPSPADCRPQADERYGDGDRHLPAQWIGQWLHIRVGNVSAE